MKLFSRILIVIFLFAVISCNKQAEKPVIVHKRIFKHIIKPAVIVDCNYSFEEAIAGTEAPQNIIDQLQLINVQYFSTDKKLHQGQILTNRKMADKVQFMFRLMREFKFPVVHAIPVVKYNWDDEKSMEDNNTYSFCYRNVAYSKHARGLAIDINPYFNPVRWKEGYKYRQNKPVGAVYNPETPGTFCESDTVVQSFIKLGLRWGHNFPRKSDDHHFEM
jgi:hypothetical protein